MSHTRVKILCRFRMSPVTADIFGRATPRTQHSCIRLLLLLFAIPFEELAFTEKKVSGLVVSAARVAQCPVIWITSRARQRPFTTAGNADPRRTAVQRQDERKWKNTERGERGSICQLKREDRDLSRAVAATVDRGPW